MAHHASNKYLPYRVVDGQNLTYFDHIRYYNNWLDFPERQDYERNLRISFSPNYHRVGEFYIHFNNARTRGHGPSVVVNEMLGVVLLYQREGKDATRQYTVLTVYTRKIGYEPINIGLYRVRNGTYTAYGRMELNQRMAPIKIHQANVISKVIPTHASADLDEYFRFYYQTSIGIFSDFVGRVGMMRFSKPDATVPSGQISFTFWNHTVSIDPTIRANPYLTFTDINYRSSMEAHVKMCRQANRLSEDDRKSYERLIKRQSDVMSEWIVKHPCFDFFGRIRHDPNIIVPPFNMDEVRKSIEVVGDPELGTNAQIIHEQSGQDLLEQLHANNVMSHAFISDTTLNVTLVNSPNRDFNQILGVKVRHFAYEGELDSNNQHQVELAWEEKVVHPASITNPDQTNVPIPMVNEEEISREVFIGPRPTDNIVDFNGMFPDYVDHSPSESVMNDVGSVDDQEGPSTHQQGNVEPLSSAMEMSTYHKRKMDIFKLPISTRHKWWKWGLEQQQDPVVTTETKEPDNEEIGIIPKGKIVKLNIPIESMMEWTINIWKRSEEDKQKTEWLKNGKAVLPYQSRWTRIEEWLGKLLEAWILSRKMT